MPCLIKENWHDAFQKTEPYQEKYFLHYGILQFLVIFSLVWWSQTCLWCYCETTDVTMAKTKMFIFASNLWWNLQYQNGKEVNLGSYRYIKYPIDFCISASSTKLLFICSPLSLSLSTTKKYSGSMPVFWVLFLANMKQNWGLTSSHPHFW